MKKFHLHVTASAEVAGRSRRRGARRVPAGGSGRLHSEVNYVSIAGHRSSIIDASPAAGRAVAPRAARRE